MSGTIINTNFGFTFWATRSSRLGSMIGILSVGSLSAKHTISRFHLIAEIEFRIFTARY